jgi:hypothetical protein
VGGGRTGIQRQVTKTENDMQIPKVLREQVRAYEKAGFNVVDCKPASGAHFKLWFKEFEEPQVVTKNVADYRAMKNNLSQLRRKSQRRAV